MTFFKERWRRRGWRDVAALRRLTRGEHSLATASGPQRTTIATFSASSQQRAIAIGVGILALSTYLWQLSVPIFLQLYDSGVYLASAIHLVSGVVPYRDFSFVQPPGILWILSPIALISRLYGSHDGFILARVLNAFVTALDVSLLSWLVRRSGRSAMIIAGVGLGLIPVAVFFSSGIRLEPFCLLFVLLGSLKLTTWDVRAGTPSTSSLLGAGLFYGVAGSIEFWAIFPFLAFVICLILRYRPHVLTVVAGASVGIILPCLPFLIVAPRNFVQQVFLDQLHHPRLGADVLTRFVFLSGFSGTSLAPAQWGAVLIFALLGVLAVVTLVRGDNFHLVNVYLLAAAGTSVGGLLTAPAAYRDYGYFAAPFLCGLVAATFARLIDLARPILRRLDFTQSMRVFLSATVTLTGAIFVFGAASYDATFYSIDLPLTGVSSGAISALSREIPSGACVVYDTVGMGLLANRFETSDPHCPTMVDPFGESMASGYQMGVPPAHYVAQWTSILRRANYLVVAEPIVETPAALREIPYQGMIAWSEPLQQWFAREYRLVSCHLVCVYRRTT